MSVFAHLCAFSFATNERCGRDQLYRVSQRRFRCDSRQHRQSVVGHFAVLLLASYLQYFFQVFLLIGSRWHDYHTIEKIDRYAVRTFVIRASDSCDSW